MSKRDPKTLSDALKELEQESRDSLSGQLDALKKIIADLEPKITAVAKSAISESKDQIEKRVNRHPLMAIGIVALVVFVIGWVITHREKDEE